MNTRREELERLTVKNGLRPIAKSLRIKNISKMNKNILIVSILDFESQSHKIKTLKPIPKLYKSCGNCNKTNFITCVNVIICKYCYTPYDYI